MKKILTASLVAMMAVSAANADIASTQYVTDRTGNLEFSGSLENKNLTGAINQLQTDMGKISGVEGGVASGADLKAVSDKIGAVAEGETVVSMITGALDDAEKYTDDQLKNYTNTTDMESAIATAKSGAESTAAGYTDEKVGAVNTALTEYKTSNDLAVKANADAIAGLNTTYVSEEEMTAFKTANTTAIADAKTAAETTAAGYTDEKVGALDVADTAVAGEYVSAVSEADGKISVTRASLTAVAKMNVPEACEKGTATCALVYDNVAKGLKWESIVNQ